MNPIITALLKTNPQMSNLASVLNAAKGNPEQFFNNLMQSNPEFKRFVEANKGKSPEQIAKDNGVDLSAITQLLK